MAVLLKGRCQNGTVLSAARNVNGRVIMYADRVTKSMQICLDETQRRRDQQQAHNVEHGIVPKSVSKSIRTILEDLKGVSNEALQVAKQLAEWKNPAQLRKEIKVVRQQMLAAGAELNFERAADLRDKLLKLEKQELGLTG